MILTMHLEHEPFEKIKSGRKTVEMRLYDEKRRALSGGDYIEFVDKTSQEKFLTKVVATHIYQTFAEVYRDFSKAELGYEAGEIASPKDMEKYYPLDKQLASCVVSIEIMLADYDEIE